VTGVYAILRCKGITHMPLICADFNQVGLFNQVFNSLLCLWN